MEELKNIKLNTEELPEVPRTAEGEIDLEAISQGKSKRNNDIVSDDIFNAYYRELPNNVENTSGSWRTTPSGGKIKILGGDPEGDKDIHIKGAEALNATRAQRRSFSEVIQATLSKKASTETIEELELTTDTDHLAAITAAAIKRAERGDVKAMEFIRDTIGEKPTDKISADVTALTPEDREMLQRVQARLDNL